MLPITDFLSCTAPLDEFDSPSCHQTHHEGVIENVTHEDAGSGNCVYEFPNPARADSIHEFFNLVATETLALFDHLEFEFLTEYDVFAPAHRRRTRVHDPPELFRGFLHCYYKDIYGVRPVARELQNTLVWLGCGFGRPPSRDAVDRFLTDLEHVVDDVFDRLVE